MDMHFMTFVFIANDADVDAAVAEMLEPFSEALEVKPWKRYLDPEEIAQMAKFYGVPATHLLKLAGRMEDWSGGRGGIDADQGAQSLLKRPTLADHLPHDFLTPDGIWHEVETFVRTAETGGRFDRSDNKTWLKDFKAALQTYAKFRVVCVDRHA
jgi:hypothetical protein